MATKSETTTKLPEKMEKRPSLKGAKRVPVDPTRKFQKSPSAEDFETAMRKAKGAGKAEDTTKRDGVTSITGKALTGDALVKFKGAYDASALLRSSYNADGTLKDDTKKIVE